MFSIRNSIFYNSNSYIYVVSFSRVYLPGVCATVWHSYTCGILSCTSVISFWFVLQPSSNKFSMRDLGYIHLHRKVPDERYGIPIHVKFPSAHQSSASQLQVNLDMTDHCTMYPVRCISSIHHMHTTDFAYYGPIFLVPLSPSYPSSPVFYSLLSLYFLYIYIYVDSCSRLIIYKECHTAESYTACM